MFYSQIPDKALEDQRLEVKRKPSEHLSQSGVPASSVSATPSVQKDVQQHLPDNVLEYGQSDDEEEESTVEEPEEDSGDLHPLPSNPRVIYTKRRRLSTFESNDGIMDLESDVIGGSARSFEPGSLLARSVTLRHRPSQNFAP